MNLNVFDEIIQKHKESFLSHEIKHGLLEVNISSNRLMEIVSSLKERFLFDLFLDVTAVDFYQKRTPRFQVVYHFYSTTHLVRLRIKSNLQEEELSINSLTSLFGSAHYMERECHEMYGIQFIGNKDLRPILLYNGFSGHPLRKDYPIGKEQPLVPYIK